MLILLAQDPLQTLYGTFLENLFYDGQREYIAMTMGEVAGAEDVLCRIHSSCIHGHHFNSIECTCREEMAQAQQQIQAAGRGVIIWLEQEGKGNGHLALLKSKPFKRQGMSQGDAYEAAGYQRDARDYTPAAKILKALNIKSARLLTGNVGKAAGMTQYGVEVTGTRELSIKTN